MDKRFVVFAAFLAAAWITVVSTVLCLIYWR